MRNDTSNVRRVAVDLAKHVFHIIGHDRRDQMVVDQRLNSRQALYGFLRSLPSGTVVLMETGPGAQAWARECQTLGLLPRILPAQRVAEHRSGPKNDRRDAFALLRADRDTTIMPVPIKSAATLSLQALHRVRSGKLRRRTQISNQIRGLLIENGIVLAKGDHAIAVTLDRLLGDASVPIPDLLRELIADLQAEWRWLGEQASQMKARITRLAISDHQCQRLATTRGIGPMIASAVACKQVDPDRFANGRQFAAYFGLVPDQHSTGGKTRLGKMTKRGDGYIRNMLIEGAHAVLNTLRPDDNSVDGRRLQRWLKRHGRKGAAVRLANRNARIAWALLKRNTEYQANYRRERTDELIGPDGGGLHSAALEERPRPSLPHLPNPRARDTVSTTHVAIASAANIRLAGGAPSGRHSACSRPPCRGGASG